MANNHKSLPFNHLLIFTLKVALGMMPSYLVSIYPTMDIKAPWLNLLKALQPAAP
jgi:hypothetical protein